MTQDFKTGENRTPIVDTPFPVLLQDGEIVVLTNNDAPSLTVGAALELAVALISVAGAVLVAKAV